MFYMFRRRSGPHLRHTRTGADDIPAADIQKKRQKYGDKKKRALRVDCTAGQVEAGGARGRGDRSRGWPVGGLLRSLGNCGGGHSRLDLINRIVWELLGS